MRTEDLKRKAEQSIDQHRRDIKGIAEKMYKHPELGYKEIYATKEVRKLFEMIGLKDIEENIAVTGVQGTLNPNGTGPHIVVMGELDSVISPDHPDATETGAIHACGHNNQVAAMVGTAYGLAAGDVVKKLNGRVTFMAVPAEEFIELDFRSTLIDQGEIQFYGGKQELIARGAFDDVDLAMMIHSIDLTGTGKKMIVAPQGNGFLGKKVRFIGKESHAGAAPEEGINALNAAMLAMNNINANRETFRDEDKIRVHPIITKGGDIVNIVPSDVRMESYVRGSNLEGIQDANEKVNRSIIHGAKAVGAKVRIEEIPGYFPLIDYEPFADVFYQNALEHMTEEEILRDFQLGGSFDIGDLSHIMPVLHPLVGGITGALHTREFSLSDPELAYIIPAKMMAKTIIDLLADGGEKANDIIEKSKPPMTKDEYLAIQRKNARLIEE